VPPVWRAAHLRERCSLERPKGFYSEPHSGHFSQVPQCCSGSFQDAGGSRGRARPRYSLSPLLSTSFVDRRESGAHADFCTGAVAHNFQIASERHQYRVKWHVLDHISPPPTLKNIQYSIETMFAF